MTATEPEQTTFGHAIIWNAVDKAKCINVDDCNVCLYTYMYIDIVCECCVDNCERHLICNNE